MSQSLPIEDVLGELRLALDGPGAGVLIAPPGAGKTTAVAPALLDESWCEGQIILTSPRRVAARAAAERMAELAGEKVCETFGYATRLDTRISARTRVIVMTEGIFVNRILADPELPGVSAVLFDEAHERHLDCDLGLALALEARSVLRDDLRVLAMSATIDGARFARLLGRGARVVESQGRSFPLDVVWLGGDPAARIEDRVTQAIQKAWTEQDGDILAFLPGVGEIARVRERVAARFPENPIHALHGQVDPSAQRAAIRRDPNGLRRIVLASAIAETSLTLDGVNVVVDSGLARYGEFDPAAGTTRLVTRAASQASATQRAGRAARQGPGVAYRLWDEHGHAGRPEFAPPEIEIADLAPLVLSLADWGTKDPNSLAWLNPPPDAAIANARDRLAAMGALDEQGGITPWGRQIAALPLDPASAAAILFAAKADQALDAAKLVVLLQERGLGGRGEDLQQRLARWNDDRGKRAQAARELAARWARAAEKLVSSTQKAPRNPALFLARARPDMIAKRRDQSGEYWLSAGGRGFMLDPASSLARAEWIVIGDATGRAKSARITAAAELTDEDVNKELESLIEKRSVTGWNSTGKRVEARIERKLGSVTLASGPDSNPDNQAIVDTLVDKAMEKLGELLPASLLARARYADVHAISLEGLRETSDIWLTPLLEGRRDLNVPAAKLADAVLSQLDWETRRKLDEEAPTHFVSPAETRHVIDYAGDDAPSIEVRVQALFGLDRHPLVGATALLLKLTSPAGRPIQSTRDLPGFWRGSWAEVAKDMKGRYPKHRWPEKPWLEKPSLKTKNAFNREGS